MTTFKLPKPTEYMTADETPEYLYTEAQFKQGVCDVLEQAARVCESMQAGWASDHHLACAAAIRKMIGEI